MPTITSCDLFIIGGGINGIGIANDAAGRDLSVILAEQNDLASGTSNWSSKLIHGGIRYLEHYEFNLVRKALKEQEILMKKAPFLIRPLPFIFPYIQQKRPIWMIQMGMWLYDLLGSRKNLPRSKKIRLNHLTSPSPLKKQYTTGFCYYDCITDDARLVVLNAMQARDNGATIHTHTVCQEAYRDNGLWHVTCLNKKTGTIFQVQAKALINATGPWSNITTSHHINADNQPQCTLSQGSHIIVKRLYPENQAYILQTSDQRIIFTIPYNNNFTLIGTSDTPFEGDPSYSKITDNEINYLLNLSNEYFNNAISRKDIISSYSGVRALFNDKSTKLHKTTRDYKISIQDNAGAAPLVTLLGGKITTYRKLAEETINQLETYFPHMGPSWTLTTPLPGGQLHAPTLAIFIKQLNDDFPWLSKTTLTRYAYSYGYLTYELLKDTHSIEDLGQLFGADLYLKEVEYLIQNEWACTADDILWRRTKCGLLFNEKAISDLKYFFQKNKTNR